MTQVAVIGGSGFIGTRLVRRLLEGGASVRIIDRAMSTQYPELTTLCDVRDLDSLCAACEGSEVLYNLAAEHRDDVRPESLYEEVNVGGARNTCTAARRLDIRRILFTSSVAVYGFGETERDETVEPAPFNAYGRSKLAAERVFLDWCKEEDSRSLGVIRPTVVFGEDNRGNVYTLLRQIAEGPFTMIGDGSATKSMAYVENVAAFLVFASSFKEGVHLYNYVDKPDFDMNRLVATIRRQLGRSPGVGFRIPYRLGYAAGWVCDGISALLGRPLPISRIRVRKFCSSTRFSAARALATGFAPPHDLAEALCRTVQHEFGAPSRATR